MIKHLHIPSFIILGVSVFCVSAKHYELANTVGRWWTLVCVMVIIAYIFSAICLCGQVVVPKDRIMKTVCVIGVLEVLYSIVQLFGIVPDNYCYAPFSGSLNNPAVYGMYLSFCSPVSIYYCVRSVGRERQIWGLLAVIFVVFVLLSDSRTAFLASLSGTAVVLMIEDDTLRKFFRNRKNRVVGVGCIVGIFIALYFYKRNSADGRLLIWRVCLEMIKDHPWTGVGFDGYIAQYMNYQADYLVAHPESPYMLLAGETQNPFNEFLHMAVLYGIPCAVMFIMVLSVTIWYICCRVREYKSVSLALVLVFIVWCMFSYPMNIPFVWLVLLYLYLSLLKPDICIPASKRCLALVLVFLVVECGLSCISSIRDIRRILLQERAEECCDNNVMAEYEEMYRDYSDNYQFVYNYGAVLHQRGEYSKSVEVFERGMHCLSDYNMMLLMGDGYQQLKRYDLALACYARAGEMVPSRYLPLYYSMQVYVEMGDTVEARRAANAILHKKKKIKSSRLTRQVVKEAEDCLAEP